MKKDKKKTKIVHTYTTLTYGRMYTGRRQKIHFLMYTRNKGNEPTILQTLNLLAMNAICFPFRVRNTFPNLSSYWSNRAIPARRKQRIQ